MTIILIRADNRHVPTIESRTVYVCVCNGVTDHQIRQAAAAGCGSMAELTMRTGCGSNCGSCLDTAADLLRDEAASRRIVQLLPLADAA